MQRSQVIETIVAPLFIPLGQTFFPYTNYKYLPSLKYQVGYQPQCQYQAEVQELHSTLLSRDLPEHIEVFRNTVQNSSFS